MPMATRYRNMTAEQKKKCHERTKQWKLKNRVIVAERKRRHYYANRDKYLAIERNRAYQKRYGITIEAYDEILKSQGGVCAICGSDKAGKRGQCFAVDHCHETGKIRGLLCVICNTRIGWLNWFSRHREVIESYLAKHKDDA